MGVFLFMLYNFTATLNVTIITLSMRQDLVSNPAPRTADLNAALCDSPH